MKMFTRKKREFLSLFNISGKIISCCVKLQLRHRCHVVKFFAVYTRHSHLLQLQTVIPFITAASK